MVALSLVALATVGLPAAVLAAQLALAGPVMDCSRNRAIAQAAELIRNLEGYRAREGRYPASLAAVWKDCQPSVAGIEKYHYAPNGEAYDLFYQPRIMDSAAACGGAAAEPGLVRRA